MKKIIVFVLSLALVSVNVFMAFEGAFALADVSSTVAAPGSTSLAWDLELILGNEISLVCENANDVMSFGGPYSGIAGTNGNVDLDRWCKVITNDDLGWQLAIRVTNTPALIHDATYNISDYNTTTPSAWVVTSTDKYFGFSASSSKATSSFSNTFTDRYRGFQTTSDIPVAYDATSTDINGVRTDLRFRVYVGSLSLPHPGTYRAHVIVTATGL